MRGGQSALTGRARFTAGLQAGMAGALVFLAWMALSMVWARHSIWWFPNLMATTLGGEDALQNAFGKYTPAGLALVVAQYSLLGGLVAWLMPRGTARAWWLPLFGVLAGLAYYFVMFSVIWRHQDPLIAMYGPDRQLLVGHILYGAMLGRIGRYLGGEGQ